jgi:hypothetical protein
MHTTRDGFTHLTTFSEVVYVLGGANAVVGMTRSSRSSFWNWKRAGQFPPKHYRMMRQALFEHGCIADLHLWAFSTPPDEKASIADDVAA